MALTVLYYDIFAERLCRVDGSPYPYIPFLFCKVDADSWVLHFVTTTSGTIATVDLSAVSACAAVANTFTNFDDSAFVTIDDTDIDKSSKASGIFTCVLNTVTDSFVNQIADRESIPGFFEFVLLNSSAKVVKRYRFPIIFKGSLNEEQPDPTPTSAYLTATEIYALLNAKVDLIGSEDIEITDYEKGIIQCDANGVRYRQTITTDGIPRWLPL